MKDFFPLLPRTLIGEDNLHPGVEEGLLAHTGEERVIVEHRLLENGGVGLERHGDTVLVRRALTGKRSCHVTSLEALGIDMAVTVVFDLQPLGERVCDRRTDAVQTPRHLIPAAAEFTAGVEFRIDDLKRRLARLLVETGRNTAPVILDGHGVIRVDGHENMRTAAVHHLVDRVVHDLIHKVVQTAD